MTISIHQPNFLPWLGYFYKIHRSDFFVILDDVQFTKNGFINRNRIKTPQGENWITMPVRQTGKFGQNINETLIVDRSRNAVKIIKSLQANYSKSPHFEQHFEFVSNALLFETDNLAEYNIHLLKSVMQFLDIKTETIRSSELKHIEGTSTERLVNICSQLKASSYLCGFGGKKYQDEEMFTAQNIEVVTSPFQHPVYNQRWGTFIPNMSIVDLILNEGVNAKEILFGL